MRSKKHRNSGFTMMEMLATILILLVILVIASPNIRKMLSTSNELSKSYIEEITIDAAREYATVINKDVTKTLKKPNDQEVRPLDVLINLGLIEEEDKEKLGPTASVLLTYEYDSNIKYEIIYVETIIKNNNPYIILYGSTVYVERGSVYIEPGYKALDKDGKNITSKVIVTGTVNVSSFGMYQLTYNVADDDGYAAETKTRTVMVVDGTYPSATTVTATSNNPYDNKLAKNGETVTVNITFNKEVTNPTVTIGGRTATVTGSGATRTATYTIPPSESTLVNKAIEIKISNYKDLYDNNGTSNTGVTTGGAVVFDNIKPVILSSTIISNNGNNKLAKNNERLYMETNFSEAIRSVTSTLQGRATTLTGTGTAKVTSTYLIPAAEATMTQGNITGLITSYMDRAGNVGTSNNIRLVGATVFYDRTAPTCTVSYVDPAWTNGNRTVTATCNDTGGSGCLANLSHTYTSTINTTTAGAVDNGVGGTVYDNAGNARACPANQTVRIDKILPSVTAHNPTLRNWLNTNITISLSATDSGGSNLASYQSCYTTNGNTCTPSTVGNTVTLTSTGQYTVCSRAVDGANNMSPSTTCSAANAYKIDKSVPTISMTSSGNKTVAINCSDTGGSGCNTSSYQYRTAASTFTCNSGGTWINYTAPVNLTSNAYVCMRGKDNAGSDYAYSTTQLFTVDNTPPTVSISGVPANWQNINSNVSINCNDASGCDVSSYQYRTATSTFTCNSSGTWNNYTSAVSITGHTFICMRARDTYGNGYTYSSTVEIKVDKTLPTIGITGVVDETPTITCSDAGGSNCNTASYQYRTGTSTFTCNSSGTWNNYTGPLTLSNDTYVCMRGMDNAGNGYAYSTTQLFPIDTTPSTPVACFTYTIMANEVTITDYNDSCTKDVVIPKRIEGNLVVKIGDSAFREKNLTSAVIPNSVKIIEIDAFYRNLITSLYIPDSVLSIGSFSFMYNQIKNLRIPNTSIILGSCSFYENQLESVVLPDNITTISSQLFAHNVITNVNIPSKVTTINYQAFYDNQLSNIVLPETLITIGESAFSENRLEGIILPNNVKNIGRSAFKKNKIPNIIIPSSVNNIGITAFNNNLFPDSSAIIYARNVDGSKNLEKIVSYGGARKDNIVIPNGVKIIGQESFGASEITSVTLPNTIITIESGAFISNNLTNIILPNSVTSVGNYAFRNNQLASVTFSNNLISIGISSFELNVITSVVLPNSLTSIDEYAFSSNRLTSLTIPNSVVNVGEQSFRFNLLTSITIPESIDIIKSWTFGNNNLSSVTIPNNIKTIEYCAFSANNLKSVKIPSNVVLYDLENSPSISTTFSTAYVTVNNSAGGTYTAPSQTGKWTKQ